MKTLRNLILIALGFASSACTQLKLAAVNTPAWFGDYSRITDIAYGSLPAQRLDIYKPLDVDKKKDSSAAPVVIFIHGGGWNSGDKSDYRFVGAALAEQGWIGVAIDYRLYPEVKFPAFADDAALAVKYVQEHAAAWGGDPKQIFLMGHSAGGHIAALLALDDRFLRNAGVDRLSLGGVIGLAGPYDFIPFTYDYMHDLFGPESKFGESQPINFARADVPPLLLLHGLADTEVLPRNAINLTNAIQKKGGSVQTHYYADVDHTDIIAALSIPARGRAPTLQGISDFIRDTSRPNTHLAKPASIR